MQIQSSDATLGAYVFDVNLWDLTDDEWSEIYDAFLQYAVLVFPEANLNTNQQIEFSERFGTLEQLSPDPTVKAFCISNIDTYGKVLPLDNEDQMILRGNEHWHIDSSFMPVSAKATCVSALIVPDNGGGELHTADLRATYDALDAKTKELVSNLSAYHSYYYSQAILGHQAKVGSAYGFHREGAPLRPLVKTHPETGRKALFIGRHAFRIPGMKDGDALDLLQELNDFACQSPRVFEYQWNEGDLAVWDNRCAMHRVTPYDFSKTRIVRHTRVSGDVASESADTNPDEQPPYFVSAST